MITRLLVVLLTLIVAFDVTAMTVAILMYTPNVLLGLTIALVTCLSAVFCLVLFYGAVSREAREVVKSNNSVVNMVGKWLAVSQIESTNTYYKTEAFAKDIASIKESVQQITPTATAVDDQIDYYKIWLDASVEMWKLESNEDNADKIEYLQGVIDECWEKMDSYQRERADLAIGDVWKYVG